MKTKFKMDAFLPWEIGLILIIIGIALIIYGYRQSKKNETDLNNLPWTKPTTKIIFGGAIIVIGVIQLFPLLKLL